VTSSKASTFVRDATGLTKQISSLDALGMSLSGMGLLYVFNTVAFTPAFYPTANPLVGPLVGLLLVLPIAVMYALLAIAMPRSGGDYVWTSRILNPGLGFVVNFAITVLSLSIVGSVGPWIPNWSLGPMFYDLGLIWHSQSYLNTANYLQGQSASFWITAAFLAFAAAVVIFSTRLSSAIVKYWTISAIVIGAIFVGVVLYAGNSGFIQNFNSIYASSGITYDSVIQAGQTAGAYNGVPPIFSSSTLYAGALGLLGYLAFYYPAYFAGEVKRNRRTQLLAQIGSVFIFAIVTTILVVVEYFGEGPSFVNAMANLWVNGSPSFPYLNIPLASSLSVFWTQNPVLVSLFNLSFGLTVEVMNIAILFTLSRNLFAWSFDRVVPSSFASLNARTRTPVNAVILMTVVSVIYLYIAVFYSGLLSTLFSYGTAGIFLAFIFVSVAAIVLPYRRKDIFGSADGIVKYRVAGIPLVSIVGVLSLIVSALSVYAIILPSIGGPSFFTVLLDGLIPTFAIGAILYGVATVIRRSQRIDLNLISKEIPPE
jgi:amino acid transporter